MFYFHKNGPFKNCPIFTEPDLKRARRTGLSARRARRTNSSRPQGRNLEVALDFQLHIFPKETRIIPFVCLSSRFSLFLIVLVSLPCHRCRALAGRQTTRPAPAARNRVATASQSSCMPLQPENVFFFNKCRFNLQMVF